MSEKIPVLIMIQGHEPGARWKLAETRVTTLGRSKRNQIKLTNPSVSRFHCEISYINGLWYVADLNSKKGTYLNGREVTEREVIKPGDVIRLSKNVFKFDMVDKEADEGLKGIREAEGRKKSRYSQMKEEGALEKAEESSAGLAPTLKNQMRNIVLLVVVLIVTCGAAYGSLAYADYQVEKAEKIQEQRRQKLQNELEEVRSSVKVESPPYGETYDVLRDLVENYPGAPQAMEAARLYQQLEVEQFNQNMTDVQQNLEERDYKTAYKQCHDLANTLKTGHLIQMVEKQKTYILRLARVSMKHLLSEARMMARNGRIQEALDRFKSSYKEYAATNDLQQRAEQMLQKMEEVNERNKRWEASMETRSGEETESDGEGESTGGDESTGDEGEPLSDEEMRKRFKPPSRANW